MTADRAAGPGADELATRAWEGMRALVLEHHDRRKDVTEALDMSFIRAKALTKLAARPMTMRQLGTRLAIDPPYTTVVVDDLERRGLVARTVHPDDRRSKLVTVTPAGAAAAEVAERILNAPPAPLCDLEPGDLAALARIVDVLIAAGGKSDAS
ncbi:MAG: MarR family winged helix-turn-helix transcriptional regulator [Mycobacteriales bacterium]